MHGPAAQLVQGGGPAYGQHGALGMEGIGQTGDGVGKPRGRVHYHPRSAGDTPPRVGHVHGRLLVAGVDDPKAHVVQHVERGQDMVSRQREDGVHAFELECVGD